MKQLFFILFILALNLGLTAQKAYIPTPVVIGNAQQLKVAEDTLLADTFSFTTPAIYAAPSIIGGYASGNNGYGDVAKAQTFNPRRAVYVHGAIVWFGVKEYTSNADTSVVNINMYNMAFNATGTSTLGPKLCPDTVNQRVGIKMADIDTSVNFTQGANVVTWASPFYSDSLFAVGFSFEDLEAGDTLAAYTNLNGEATTVENSFELESTGTWKTLNYNWGLDVDLAIFPIVEYTATGVNTAFATKPNIYPNPAHQFISVTQPDVASYVLYNTQGQALATGTNAKRIDTTTLPNGTYYLLLLNKQGKGFAQAVIVNHP